MSEQVQRNAYPAKLDTLFERSEHLLIDYSALRNIYDQKMNSSHFSKHTEEELQNLAEQLSATMDEMTKVYAEIKSVYQSLEDEEGTDIRIDTAYLQRFEELFEDFQTMQERCIGIFHSIQNTILEIRKKIQHSSVTDDYMKITHFISQEEVS